MTLLPTLEAYYDAAPRPMATVEEVGPFTLFLRSAEEGWPFYARPTLGYDGPCTPAQVGAVRRRQRELEVPESMEWVHETTPTLLAAAREAGLHVAECPLLLLPDGARPVTPPLPPEVRISMLAADSSELPRVLGAIEAGFNHTDDFDDRAPGHVRELLRSGLLATAGAYDARGTIGGGTHSPRGTTTELTGISVIPRARRQGVGAAITAVLVADARARGVTTVFLSAADDAVVRVYERLGFQRIGTACVAEAREGTTPP